MDRIMRILPAWLTAAIAALVLAVGLAGELPAAEATAATKQDIPSTDNLAAESLSEMPIAEMEHFSIATSRADVPREVARVNASPLPTADMGKDRSAQLEQVAQQADEQTRHGFELAERGALFAARSKFLGALRLVAEGLDTEQTTSVHGRALSAALAAMKEAEDFLPGGSRIETDVDVPGVVAVHTTPVLKDGAQGVSSLTALRCYHTFAQEQFAAAVGHEVAGSMALHAMGKLHAALAQKKGALVVAPESKAVVFYQASLLAYPQNFMAANDLGVLLARCGRAADARTMLERSLSACPQSTGWQNLAAVYRQLGQMALAERATRQAAILRDAEVARRRSSPVGANDLVRWVEPTTFAQTSTNLPNSPGLTLAPPVQTAGLPAELGRAQLAGQPATASSRPAPTLRPAPEMSPPATTARLAPATNWPAPTPAAAGRMSRSPAAYQR